MKQETYFRKGNDGYEGNTEVVLGPATDDRGRQGNRVLKVNTWKSGKHLVTRCSVVLMQDDGGYTWIPTSDYGKRIRVVEARCTEKAVRDTHTLALRQLPTIIAEAKAHYGMTEVAAECNPVLATS